MSISFAQTGKEIPGHVLSAFQLEGRGEPTSAAWGNGLRFGHVVVARANATSAWSGKAREKIAGNLDGMRISRPVRATDGRLVVGGYAANEFAEGAPAARIDEAVATALRFDVAVEHLDAPTTVARKDQWAEIDRAVWAGENVAGWVGGEPVVAHLEFLTSCLFDGTLPPTLAGFTPSVELRPRGYTAALVIVDGLLHRAVDQRILERRSHVPDIRHLTRKALEFRELGLGGRDPNLHASVREIADLLMSD